MKESSLVLSLNPAAACAPAPTFIVPLLQGDQVVVRFDTAAAAAPQPTFHYRIVQ